MDKTYAIGLDFGTQSGRAVLLDIQAGELVAQAVMEYPHGVMDRCLPDGTKLPQDWALEHPQDYLDVLKQTVPAVLRKAGALPEQVIGLSVDFTACTMLPVDAQGTPLCLKPEFEHTPNAWPKLWKHHGAQDQANRINALAEKLHEPFLSRYGGKISSEWMLPKIMQILEEAPEVYAAAHRFMEAGDWITMQMTGEEKRSASMAGYKALWHKESGYPAEAFLKALDPRLAHLTEEKLSAEVCPQGAKAGVLTQKGAELTGLCPGTAVAVASIDAHAGFPAAGIAQPGKMLMIMGTSTCHILLGEQEQMVPGMCGVVADGVLPGFFGYEAGQCCVGDHFEWCVKNCVPPEYFREAEQKQMDIHQLLTEKAAALRPGESGLLALDWWNGNRSVLVDADLTGLMLGMTLTTRPEEIYRALIEATAYGTRVILENFEANGIPVQALYACGGIAKKNPLLMQIYADVTGKELFIVSSDQAPALGAAIFGAVAAGREKGGFDTVFEAAEKIGRVEDRAYAPNARAKAVYDVLYAEFKTLHDYFGRGGNDVMKRLKRLKENGEN